MKEVNWNAITAIATVVIAVTGVVAVGFAIVQINDFREESKIQHLEARVDEYDSPRFVAIRKSLAEQRIDQKQQRLRELDPENPPNELIDELNFCNDLGLLVTRKALDRNDVWNEYSDWLFVLYTDARQVIDTERKEDGPAYYGDCTDLIESIVPIEKAENDGHDDHPSQTDIYQFYLGELDAQPDEPVSKGRQARPSHHTSR